MRRSTRLSNRTCNIQYNEINGCYTNVVSIASTSIVGKDLCQSNEKQNKLRNSNSRSLTKENAYRHNEKKYIKRIKLSADEVETNKISDEPNFSRQLPLIQNKVVTESSDYLQSEKNIDVTNECRSNNNNVEEEVLNYQKLRECNLKANQELFAKLGFVQLKHSKTDNIINISKMKTKQGSLKKETNKVNLRRSLRIKHIDPLGTPLPDPQIDQDNSEENRLPSGPVSFKDTVCLIKDYFSDKKLLSFSNQICQSPNSRNLIHENVTLTTFVESLQKVDIAENLVAKVVPGRVFSLAWHPSPDTLITIAGDKYGHIGFWNVLGHENITTFKPHTKPVSHLAMSPLLAHKLYSCSYDATLRCGDFERAVFDEVFSVPEEQGDLFRNFDFVDYHTLLVSQYSGNVSLIDIRTPSPTAEHVYRVTAKSLRCVNVHPAQCHYFITAGNDAVINLWDLRFISKKHPKSIQKLTYHTKSVASACFSPSGAKILSSSADNTILVYSFEQSKHVELLKEIKHNNNTGRWLTQFQPRWHPFVEDIFISGSMNRPRQIEVFHCNGAVVRALTNENSLSSVCSLNVFHPNKISTVVGANSSGRLFVFM